MTILYHYTSARGFQGIVESGSVFATHVGYLNDESEMQYAGAELLALMNMRADQSGDPEAKDIANMFGALMYRARLPFSRPERTRMLFVASFCAQGDLLSQWQGY